MQRRLIKQGAATLTVSLPTHWSRKHCLKAGDAVELTEHEGALVVTAGQSLAPKATQINVAGLTERLLYRTLNAAYIRGIDEIEVLFEKPEELDTTQRIADSLMGYTIIRQGKNSCLIKDISGVKPEEFDNILRRIFLLVISIAQDTHDALQKKDKNVLAGIPHRDWSVNKLAYACLRLLNKHGHQKYSDTTSVYNIVWTLEEVSDEYQNIADDAAKADGINISPKVLRLLKDLNDLLRRVYELFYRYKKEELVKLYHFKEEIKKSLEKASLIEPLDVRAIIYSERLFELLTDILQQIVAIQL